MSKSLILRQIKRNLVDADHANDHLFDTTPTNSPPRSYQDTMRNGDQSRFHELETRMEENGASTELLQASPHDRIDEEVEDDDRDDVDSYYEDDYNDDERYEHEFEFENSEGDSYGERGHRGWD